MNDMETLLNRQLLLKHEIDEHEIDNLPYDKGAARLHWLMGSVELLLRYVTHEYKHAAIEPSERTAWDDALWICK
jgi:hypothetical protein